jgi:GT2 family glycosyltransferase
MHFAMVRKSLFDKMGGFRKPYEGSQDYDLLLRVSEETEEIHHIPKVLYHWRVGQASIASGPEAKPYVFESGLAALSDALKRRGIDATAEDAPDVWKGAYRVRRKISKEMRVSIIIAFSGNKTGLRRVLDSIFVHVPQENVEIQVCAHSASRLDKEEFSGLYHRVKWEEFHGSYTLPRAFNLGLGQASGEAIFFLDESMELISAESYGCLLEHIQRAEVGAVGGKVYHFNGLVEHGGVILGPFNIVGYAHRATPDTPGYVGLKSMICNYSAVMGLGMMTRRQLLVDMGGFGEEFARAYWDVDYCLKLRELGYLVTYSPYAGFRHHIPVKALEQMVVEPEATLFRSRWQNLVDADPYFNPNFSRDLEDFSIKKLGY